MWSYVLVFLSLSAVMLIQCICVENERKEEITNLGRKVYFDEFMKHELCEKVKNL
jgi:hypothetical protein